MCKVLIILFLISISEPTRGGYNITQLKSVLSSLVSRPERDQWTNTPIFMGHHTKGNEVNSLIAWLHQTMGVTSLAMDAFLQPEQQRSLGHFNVTKDNAISLFFCHGSQDILWHSLDASLRKLRRSRLIVLLRSQRSGSHKALYNIFKRLWGLQFLNVLVLHKDNIYSYSPYPKVHFFKLDIQTDLLFPPVARDFQGYVVSTPVENDIPRVFLVHDPGTGRRQMRGYAYRTFVEYLRHHNASLYVTNSKEELNPTNSVNMSRIMQLIMEGQLEISVHPYIKAPEDWSDKSYPLVISPNCLIVPVRNEIPRHMYLLRPLSSNSWYLLLGGLIYISFVLYCLSSVRPVDGSTWEQRLGLSFLESVSRILFISSPRRTYGPSTRYFLVSFQLTVLGFVITSCYNIQLDSFLTALVVGEQVDSMDQLIQQQQRVLVKEYEVSTLLRHVEPRLVDRVARLLVGVNASEQVSALLGFNRSYAYPFTLERWQFFAMQQQYAFKPIFRFSSACLGSPLISYPMRSDCHLEATINMFIMKIQDSGLLYHWLISDFNDAMRAGYVRLLDNVLGFQAIDVNTLRLGWWVLGFGWLLSVVAFLCEYWHPT
ncbi:uncharacterized protein LOC110177749 [Drosophila serrata]|uniref:uncharacterized protein LOC110177749 n=1 Tax=Drosophila serrata TaxID=7274 RepID=UPI000A1D1C93|nr:uncharacterized protein LOC110177749 [Drosophila serrata]